MARRPSPMRAGAGALGQLRISYGQGTAHAAGMGHPGGIRGQGEGTGQQE